MPKYRIRKTLLVALITLLALLLVYIVLQASISIPDPQFYGYYPPSSTYCYSGEALIADNLWEYKLALRQLKKDDELIAYDTLKRMGGFTRFFYQSDWTSGEYGTYFYGLKGESDGVSVCPKSDGMTYGERYAKIRQQNLTDMRYCEIAGPAVASCGNILYVYYNGKLDHINWENGKTQFRVSVEGVNLEKIKPGGNTFVEKLLNGETAKKAVKQFNQSVRFNIALRKTQEIRLIAQWSVAAVCLIWGVLQLLNLPVELWRKTVRALDDETARKKYRRECGVVKILLAAVFTCMAFVELFEPVFMLAFALMYGLLLLLVLVQQLLLNREYTPKEENVP